jgi:opacity protein-like surface antigen
MYFMRKFLIALSLLPLFFLLFSPTVFAASNPYFYLSADAGIFQADFNNVYLDQTGEIPANIAQPVQQHAYTMGLALGIRKLLPKQYVIGAELSANYDNHLASFQTGAASTSFSDQTNIQNHIDLKFVPGIRLDPSLSAYLKFGLSWAAVQDDLNSPAGYTALITNTNTNKNTLGFTGGLEIEKMLTEKVSIFVEANYYDYGSLDFSNFENFAATYTHSTHIYAYDAMMGISYLFI